MSAVTQEVRDRVLAALEQLNREQLHAGGIETLEVAERVGIDRKLAWRALVALHEERLVKRREGVRMPYRWWHRGVLREVEASAARWQEWHRARAEAESRGEAPPPRPE